jgi:PKHD-type hydroxylase
LYRENLTPEECAALVDYAQAFPASAGKVGHGSGGSKEHEMRKSTVRWLPRKDLALRWLFDRITLNALVANLTAFHLALSDEPRLRFGDAQFTEYNEDANGKYDWHEDNCWITPQPRAFDRKLSCVVQLSDPADYEGGRLEFERDNLTGDTFTQLGDMIFFPSFLRHRVTPVTRGVRRSLVLWFEGRPLC